ncbi:MAG: hypothetical protein IPK71_36155 [Myxococcales bacterium]|nr:hypothetical protein [Myxococcales bacterium]
MKLSLLPRSRGSLPTVRARSSRVGAALVLAALAGTASLSLTHTGAAKAREPSASHTIPSRDAWDRFVEHERREAMRARFSPSRTVAPLPLRPEAPRPRSGLDVQKRTIDLDVDPGTGAVTATIDLDVTAITRGFSLCGLSLAPGLTVTAAELEGRAAEVKALSQDGFDYFQVTLPEAVAPGKTSRIRLRYSGTAACSDPDGACSRQPGFARYTTGSVFPYFFDLENPSPGFDGTTTDLTLRVPAGLDAEVSADKTGERAENGKTVTTWNVPNRVDHRYGFYAFIGQLGRKSIAGRTAPTTLVSPPTPTGADSKIAAWSAGALGFVEDVMGSKLPFAKQALVRLPDTLRDVGTVSYGMTLLNESYGRSGDDVYHETWVHENAHLAWAIVVPEAEASRTKMFTEGLATMTEIDFSKSLFPAEDRDFYLARRYQAIRLDWLVKGTLDKLPPVVATEAVAEKIMRSGTRDYSGWAYEKSSATLDHIRATVGDDAFTKALHEYVRTYAWTGATLDEFRALLEKSSGLSLGPLFDRFVLKTGRPELRIGLTKDASGKVTATITKDEDGTFPYVLRVTTEDGQSRDVRVVLEGQETKVPLEGAVLSVAHQPRLGVLTKPVSATTGDVNFDGDADGRDLLACAARVGEKFKADATTLGLWELDSRFPVECDLDDDGDVDDDDFAALKSAFGGNP